MPSQGGRQRLPDREVAAPRALGHGDLGEVPLGAHRETSSAIHSGVKGRPSYFPMIREP